MPRRLRPEEEELWRRVAALASPMHPDRPKSATARSRPQTKTTKPDPVEIAPVIAPFRVGETARPSPARPAPARRHPPRIDRKTFRDLSRGKRTPEATIDLHGMTLAQAHVALNRFVLTSFGAGRRLVLVITGKGKGGEVAWDGERGILRRQVPDWLEADGLGAVVQEVLPAHKCHGGSGALYVILRRG